MIKYSPFYQHFSWIDGKMVKIIDHFEMLNIKAAYYVRKFMRLKIKEIRLKLNTG